MTHRLLAMLVLLGLAAGAGHARPRRTIPVGKDRPLDILTRVPAPAARCLIVSEPLELLAVGHHAKHIAAHVSLFRLDAAGKVQGEPATLVLPRPDGLTRMRNGPTGLAFHPKRPLLYVWQDVVPPRTPQNTFAPLSAGEMAALDQIDHLLIYRIEDGKPRLLASLCRGQAFGHGRPHGSVCVDGAGERLYVPNLRGDFKNLKNEGVIAGSYVLDAEGLPVIGKKAAVAKSADLAARAIADAVKAGRPVLPQRVTPFNGEIGPDVPGACTGMGFIPMGRDRVLFGGCHDCALAMWTPEDRGVRLNLFQPPVGYRYHYPALHPTAPMIYILPIGTPHLHQLEHVEGNLTLTPVTIDLIGANQYSPPVILPKHNLLAVGSHQRIVLLSLDAKGWIEPERTQVLVGNQFVEALAYSARFDRLYVGVEKAK